MEFVFNQNKLSEVWPAPLPEFEVDPSTTALLVIDMQLNLVDTDYGFAKLINESHEKIASYYFPRMKNVVIPNNIKLVEFFREYKIRVIFLTLGSELPDGSDKMPRRKKRDSKMDQNFSFNTTFHKGAYEHSIIPKLQPLESELVINKNSTGAFNSTAIDQLLRNMGINNLIITGIITNGCVETTARDAADRGYSCILIEDACAAFSELLHYTTLLNFATMFGKVWTTSQIIKYLT